jgi:hypothetical protein
MGGGENVGERGWRRWCFLSLLCGTLDRKGVSMRRNGARQTSSRVPPTPTTLYTQVTGAHQPDKVGRPRSGRVRGKNGSSRWTRSLNVGDHPNSSQPERSPSLSEKGSCDKIEHLAEEVRWSRPTQNIRGHWAVPGADSRLDRDRLARSCGRDPGVC